MDSYKFSGKLFIIIMVMFISISSASCIEEPVSGESNTLIFSEYLEGSGYNKALELYNPTDQPVDLSEYKIVKYVNKNENNKQELSLSGKLPNYKTYVIVNKDATSELKEKGNINNDTTITTFNGDDMLELVKNNEVVDRIWFTEKKDGANIKIMRKAHITKGNIEKISPSDEWIFSNNIDDFSTLGVFSNNEPPTTQLRIHDIQGASHFSPIKNKNVSDIEGVVTAILYKYKKNSSGEFYRVFDGFTIQERDEFIDNDIKTSEGILILPLKTPSSKYDYKKPDFIDVGDLIKVSGKVIESGYPGELKQTSILVQTESNIKEISSNNSLPSPVIIGTGKGKRMVSTSIIYSEDESVAFDDANFNPETDAMDFYESLEGMLIQINRPHIIGANEKFGEVYVLADNGIASTSKLNSYGGIKTTKNNKNPEIFIIGENAYPITEPKGNKTTTGFIDKSFMPKTGDKFDSSITAVVSYAFGTYKVYNINHLPKLVDCGLVQPSAKIVPDYNKLTIASFNIENFNKNVGEEKIERLARAIICNLKAPDIIGVVEVQDNNGPIDDGTTDASQSYKTLINKIAQLSPKGKKYNYKFTDIAPENDKDGGQPGSNIRVGFLYRTDRVILVGNESNKGTFSDKGIYTNGHLNKNPVRIDPQNTAFYGTRKSLATEFQFKGQQIIVINNHFSSKRGGKGIFTVYSEAERKQKDNTTKRVEQATAVRDFVKTIPNNERTTVVVLGDMNDYEYSDPIVVLEDNGNMNNLFKDINVNERFTYIHGGSSQVLDNVLINSRFANKTTINPVNMNSMFVEADGRCSDHDPVLIQIDFTKN
ncbi:lamin tail domain-containing protein [Clostridiaceae bacterium M8S5]|nr:lamin tail domain-containing protein [Clostridiaceae bacterium M8S5]